MSNITPRELFESVDTVIKRINEIDESDLDQLFRTSSQEYFNRYDDEDEANEALLSAVDVRV